MPAHRRPDYDTDAFRQAWFSREPLRSIAARYGVTVQAIHRAAARRGFPCRFTIRNTDV